jgi:dienelactone hydrolase
MRRALAILLLVLVAGVARAETVRFPSVAVGTVAAGPELSGWLYRPKGEGPFPAIVLAHPCNGVSAHTHTWGNLLASWGYVVLAPDSFGPRGEKSVRPRHGGDRPDARRRCRGRARLAQCTTLRAKERHRPDRP